MSTVRNHTPVDSADAEGLSVITSTRRIDDPHRGMIYDPAELAALTPVHIHPVNPGRYLMVFSRHWRDATLSPGDPGSHTAHTEDTEPGWAFIDTSGARSTPGRTHSVPGPPGRTLTAATSRANTYLYLLSSHNGGARIEHFRYAPERNAMLELASEHIAPVVLDGQRIIFDRGLYVDGADLVVLGAGEVDRRLYVARKSWGRIGTSKSAATRATISDPVWRYRTHDGFSTDAAELDPLPAITSHGPVSMASYRDQLYLAAVEADGDDRLARVWRRGRLAWTPLPATVALGSVADGSYLGGTLQFQQQVRPLATELSVPYTVAVRSGGRIDVSWGSWLVSA